MFDREFRSGVRPPVRNDQTSSGRRTTPDFGVRYHRGSAVPTSPGRAVTSERLVAGRTIAASPEAIFDVLADPQGHVSIDGSGMLMSASGERVTAVGDTFDVHMDREAKADIDLGEYDVTVHITTFVRNHEIAWTVGFVGEEPLGHVFGYRFERTDEGTRVQSYYDWSGISDEWRESGLFPVVDENDLRSTLGILARTVTRA